MLPVINLYTNPPCYHTLANMRESIDHLCINPSPLVKSVYQKIIFLISQQKHMLWVLKRTLSMRRFF